MTLTAWIQTLARLGRAGGCALYSVSFSGVSGSSRLSAACFATQGLLAPHLPPLSDRASGSLRSGTEDPWEVGEAVLWNHSATEA
mmetsp:Transcript_13047/g.48433  ORF Transcript_13047/g.48433 Transcript_13047/m.48433 type:complete len:85 (-) Transcript_13047:38-292(-)